MPLALLVIGVLLVVTAIKGSGNISAVATKFETDLTGSGGFIYWIAAIVVLAIVGRVTGATNSVKMFMALVVVVYLVGQQGIWTQFSSAFAGLSAAATPAAVAPSATAAAATTSMGATGSDTLVGAPAAPAGTGQTMTMPATGVAAAGMIPVPALP
jgi:hypothetical protein